MSQSRSQSLHLHRRTSLLARLVTLATLAVTRRRDRALLARLDNHLLRDIGVEPEAAAEECAKPFWKA